MIFPHRLCIVLCIKNSPLAQKFRFFNAMVYRAHSLNVDGVPFGYS